MSKMNLLEKLQGEKEKLQAKLDACERGIRLLTANPGLADLVDALDHWIEWVK